MYTSVMSHGCSLWSLTKVDIVNHLAALPISSTVACLARTALVVAVHLGFALNCLVDS